MKRWFYVILALILPLLTLGYGGDFAVAQDKLTYARLLDGAVLYREDGDIITTLPTDYFVIVLSEQSEYYEVSYLDLLGRVDKSAVETVDFTPKYLHHTSARLVVFNDGHAVNIRSSPSHLGGEVVGVVESGGELFYYGAVEGTAQVDKVGNLWYYVKFFTLSGEASYGYVYELYAEAEPIAPNVIEAVPPTPIDDSEVSGGETFTLPFSKEAVIIVCLCIPVVIIMFLLFYEKK